MGANYIRNAMAMVLAMIGVNGGQVPTAQAAPKILIVVSSQNQLPLKNGKVYPTGYYLNELSVPAQRLAQEGYELVFADPNGNDPALDQRSVNVKYFGGSQEKLAEIKAFHDSLTGLRHPLKLADVATGDLSQFAGIFIPGGHAPMIDLMADSNLGMILKYFHSVGKPTALICHGPISLASAVDDPLEFQTAMVGGNFASALKQSENWIYKGYKMTIFSTAEENIAEANLGGETQFSVESALETLGGEVQIDQPWTSNVVRDRELITGQNPFSDEALASQLIDALAGN